MININIATLFPDMCESVLTSSMIGRARRSGLVNIFTYNIRDFTDDKHNRVDDAPYGGGKGMLMQADPIYKCFEYVSKIYPEPMHVIYLSPKGKTLTQHKALELSKYKRPLFLICGHYEGIDQRVIDEIVDEEISIGDYVLTGGELPAMVLVDAVTRLVPGVLASSECYQEESHFSGLLEYPQYTRPEIWHGKKVPEVLISGHHANIEEWKKQQSIEVTKQKRPDLLDLVQNK